MSDTVCMNATVDHLQVTDTGKITVQYTDGNNNEVKTILADHVVSTLAPSDLASVLGTTSRLTPLLSQIQNSSMGVVHIAYDEDNLLTHKGFGYLVPSVEKEKILGVVFDSIAFPSQNHTPKETRISVMMGGAHQKWIEKASQEEMFDIAQDAITKHLGITRVPTVVQSRLLKNAIPQYKVGHTKLVENIRKLGNEEFCHQFHLLGHGFDGAGISHCVAAAKKTALEMTTQIEK